MNESPSVMFAPGLSVRSGLGGGGGGGGGGVAVVTEIASLAGEDSPVLPWAVTVIV